VNAVPAYDSADFRRVLSSFPTGVTMIAACLDSTPTGLAANSFTSVSLDPPIVSVCIAHSSTTWPRLRAAERLGITVLGAHQEQASRQLSARGADRFSRLTWRATARGAVLLANASAWLECSVEREITVGDHNVVMLAVHDLDSNTDVPPLVVHGSRYTRLAPRAV
jgi:flavin reductase (DIM6/NTAB) family NADH-FMN oxidoreductase RutF